LQPLQQVWDAGVVEALEVQALQRLDALAGA
jgi:hypothetical protein